MSVLLNSKLIKEFISLPNIKDCYILKKDDHAIVYIVSAKEFPIEAIKRIIIDNNQKIEKYSFSLISTIPIDGSGYVNINLIEQYPVFPFSIESEIKKEIYKKFHYSIIESAFIPKKRMGKTIHINDLYEPPIIEYKRKESVEKVIASNNNERRDAHAIGLASLKESETFLPQSLKEVISFGAIKYSEKTIRYINQNGTTSSLSYSQLLKKACKIGKQLVKQGVNATDYIVFQVSDHESFVALFWACIIIDAIPVPLAEPPIYDISNAVSRTILLTQEMFSNRYIVVHNSRFDELSHFFIDNESDESVLLDYEQLCIDEGVISFNDTNNLDSIAVILLTSGSTGHPKGVPLTHRNIISSISTTSIISAVYSDDVILNWLPVDHPGPLIRCVIRPIFVGADQIHASTSFFMQNPIVWLDWIDEYKVTNTWAPNFAYNLLDSNSEMIRVGEWDLSSIRCLLNTAEPIIPEMMKRVEGLLQQHGLRAGVMNSSWGMAETSSGVTQSNIYLDYKEGDIGQRFAELGFPISGVELRVVDKKDNTIKEGEIGNVQVRGDTVTKGYWKDDELNNQSFTKDGWFRTGDIGFIRDNRLTLTGRGKDIIILAGRNVYCHEIESAVDKVSGIVKSFTAAVGIPIVQGGEEIAIFFNTKLINNELRELISNIRTSVLQKVGVTPSWFLPVQKDEIPKTSIGKIQRSKLKKSFLDGHFSDLAKRIDLLLKNERTLPEWFFHEKWIPDNRNQDGIFSKERITIFSDDEKFWDECLSKHIRLVGKRCPSEINDNLLIYDLYSNDNRDFSVLSQIINKCSKNDQPYSILLIMSNTFAFEPDKILNLNTAGYRGIVKCAGKEYSNIKIHLLDVDEKSSATDILADVYKETSACRYEPEVVYRNHQRYVKRLSKVDYSHNTKKTFKIDENKFYLITGGLGGIGKILTKHLLTNYNVKLLIVGRKSIQDDNIKSILRQYENLPGGIKYISSSLSEYDKIITAIKKEEDMTGMILGGIFHLAGVAPERKIEDETVDTFYSTVDTKGINAYNLGLILKDRADSFFISLSSVIGFFGGATMAAYTASNNAAEAVVHNLCNQGIPAWCLGPSTWKNVGMSKTHGSGDLTSAQGHYSILESIGIACLLGLKQFQPGLMYCGLDGTNQHVYPYLVEDEPSYTHMLGILIQHKEEDLSFIENSYPINIKFCNKIPVRKSGEINKKAVVQLLQGQQVERDATELELVLLKMWENVLGHEVGLTENFFAAGGSSLLALSLLSKIMKETGCSLNQAVLFHAPTVEKLAKQIKIKTNIEEEAILSKIVTIREEEGRRKGSVFLVHDADGNLLLYKNIASRLPSGYCVYGLPVSGDDYIQSYQTRIIDMARWFADRIEDIAENGEIIIGGLCAGGALAFETTAELEARGNTVKLVVLFDSIHPHLATKFRNKFENEQRIASVKNVVEKSRIKERIAKIVPKAKNYIKYKISESYDRYKSKNRLKKLREKIDLGIIPSSKDRVSFREIYQFSKEGYVSRHVKSPVVLFRATEIKAPADAPFDDTPTVSFCPDPYFGWKDFADNGIDAFDIEGGHSTILQEPYVEYILNKLIKYLNQNLTCNERSIDGAQLGVIILNYNTPQLTLDCLDSLVKEREFVKKFSVVVVDGGSNDNSKELIVDGINKRRIGSWVVLLSLEVNNGFAYGNNVGMKYLIKKNKDIKYFHLLNPDTIVRNYGIYSLLEFLQKNPKIGFAASSLENIEGIRRPTRFCFPTIISEFNLGLNIGIFSRLVSRYRSTQNGIPNNPCLIDWAPGASLMVKKDVLVDVGFMDEQFFLYYEETEWLYRASRKGWSCWYVPYSRVVHLIGKSTGIGSKKNISKRKPLFWYESRKYYFEKTHGVFYSFVVDFVRILGIVLNRLANLFKGRIVRSTEKEIQDIIYANLNRFKKS